MADDKAELLIIGAGIVGLAAAAEAGRRFPVDENRGCGQRNHVAGHQTGHNSGVIHSGIYYKTGSLKARNCVAGAASMKRFCQQYDIPYEECGKLIVATSEEEVPRLEHLQQRGIANGVPGLRMLNREEFQEIEPHCSGLSALQVPSTGIVDYSVDRSGICCSRRRRKAAVSFLGGQSHCSAARRRFQCCRNHRREAFAPAMLSIARASTVTR